MSSTSRVQKYRERLKANPTKLGNHLEKERLRDSIRRHEVRLSLAQNPGKLKRKRLQDAERQRKCREKKKMKPALEASTASPIGSYKCPQSFGKAMARASRAIPNSPSKKLAIAARLVMDVNPKLGKVLFTMKRPSEPYQISEETRTLVKAFFERDDISRQAPGKRDTKSVKNPGTGKRELLQKRHLVMTIGEVYAQFASENPDTKIKISKFYTLRPEHVLPLSSMPHNVCVCCYHADFDYLVQAINVAVPEFPPNGKKLLEKIICDTTSESCMVGLCHNCDNNEHIVQDLVPEPQILINKQISWKQWSDVDGRPKIVEETGNVQVAMKMLVTKLPHYRVHTFVKRTQSEYFENAKETLLDNEFVLQIDFAENFSATAQDEIQSAHWSHQQVTVFTACAWIPGGNKRSFVVVSDDLSHNKHSVWVYLQKIFGTLKQEFPTLTHVNIFSDGCASQFKNKFTLSNIGSMKEDFGLEGKWNFFATPHGKGAVDGVGGTVKRKVWMEIKSRKTIINDAKDFYESAKKIVQGIIVLFVSCEEIDEHVTFLDARWATINNILGVQSLHYFMPDPDNSNNLLVGRTSASNLKAVCYRLVQEDVEADNEDLLKVKVGDFVQVLLPVRGKKSVNRMYYAEVIAISDKEDDVILKYMKTSGNYWVWPEDVDQSCENKSVIKKVVFPPKLIDNRGHFEFQ